MHTNEGVRGMKLTTTGVAVGVVAALAIVGASSAQPVAAGPPDKVTVCHVNDNGIDAISISEKAFPAHVDHGDSAPGDEVPVSATLPFGGVYADDCTVVSNPDPTEPFVVTSLGGYETTCIDNTVAPFGSWRAQGILNPTATGDWDEYVLGFFRSVRGQALTFATFSDADGDVAAFTFPTQTVTFYFEGAIVGAERLPMTTVFNPCVVSPPDPFVFTGLNPSYGDPECLAPGAETLEWRVQAFANPTGTGDWDEWSTSSSSGNANRNAKGEQNVIDELYDGGTSVLSTIFFFLNDEIVGQHAVNEFAPTVENPCEPFAFASANFRLAQTCTDTVKRSWVTEVYANPSGTGTWDQWKTNLGNTLHDKDAEEQISTIVTGEFGGDLVVTHVGTFTFYFRGIQVGTGQESVSVSNPCPPLP